MPVVRIAVPWLDTDSLMFSDTDIQPPKQLHAISRETAALGFDMSSDIRTGSLLRFFASEVSSGSVLELGTGTGVSTCWLLDGMDTQAKLVSVDIDGVVQQIAQQYLGSDPRVTFYEGDALNFLKGLNDESVDLLFADAWPGKFEGLDLALSKLKIGGVYIVDDLLPQPNWPQDHLPNVDYLIKYLTSDTKFQTLKLNWSSGLLVARKINLMG